MSATPQIAAIILAAGLSTRAAPLNKLLVDFGGVTMVRRTVEQVLASHAAPVIVVTGHQQVAVEAALQGLDLQFTHNPDFAKGMASSLGCGLSHLPDAADGALICLGDMPEVQPTTINALISALDPTTSRDICVPIEDGRRGNPVLFGRRFFAELSAIDGDRGGKAVLKAHADAVSEVAVADPGIHIDHDKP